MSAASGTTRAVVGAGPAVVGAGRAVVGAGRAVVGAVLAPGAGAMSDQPALVAIDRALTLGGMTVERMDFPYRLAGRRRPDPPVILERAVVERAAALAERLGVPTGRLALGGRSMGGRICSQVAATGTDAACLVLVSYPLHPPGHPERLRTAHFPRLEVPCLFVSGTRDAFGAPDELETATADIPGPVTHVWLPGDHSLRRRDDEVAAVVTAWLAMTFAGCVRSEPTSPLPARGATSGGV